MGTDICMIVETKSNEGKWEQVLNPIVKCRCCEGNSTKHCTFCDPISQIKYYSKWLNDPEEHSYYMKNEINNWQRILEEKGSEGGFIVEEWYQDRNYNVFGILANVRNGKGFAGIDTGDPWPYIQNGRLLPDDSCSEVIEYMMECHHSPGWVTLEEIMKYPWESTTRMNRGLVTPEQFAEYIRDGKPSSWCGDSSGFMVRHITNEQMINLVKDPTLSYYTRISWQQTALEVGERFLERMKELAKVVGEHECRIHFYFDS
jgi:hypothetical protein